MVSSVDSLLLIGNKALTLPVHQSDEEFAFILSDLLFEDAARFLFTARSIIVSFEKTVQANFIDNFDFLMLSFRGILQGRRREGQFSLFNITE